MTGRYDKGGTMIKEGDRVTSYNNIPQEVKLVNGKYMVGSKMLSEIMIPIKIVKQ